MRMHASDDERREQRSAIMAAHGAPQGRSLNNKIHSVTLVHQQKTGSDGHLQHHLHVAW